MICKVYNRTSKRDRTQVSFTSCMDLICEVIALSEIIKDANLKENTPMN
ncbi:Uncharacterised protein [[Eubacterium] contortum]|uniref:Uncharacterized protein n=1 Tax=Faecalicatena contorta TaxID=39482 RepID=A0A174MJ63_9FIRM|nr:Uncharacterised protein [[Eubacterium] contortum] [Faecalicatena contorta]